MALIDVWGAPLPDAMAGVTVVRFEEFCATHDAGTGAQQPIAVRLAPGVSADIVAPHLAGFRLVCIEFPTFRDGRGFTLAQKLRRQYGFKGDLRATGHLVPDQLTALRSCGFSSVLTPDAHPPVQWARRAGMQSPARPQLLNRLIPRSEDGPA